MKKEKAPELITFDCPNCPNTEFRILATLLKGGTRVNIPKKSEPEKERLIKVAAGRYRVQCTACELITMVISKTPNHYINH